MPVMISMLRGINLGSYNRIKMDALRALSTSLGLRDAETYIQSGNVVFATDEHDLARLAKRIQEAIAKEFDVQTDVILRTAAELRSALERNPFAKRRGIDPAKLLVVFLATEPDTAGLAKVRKLKTDPEELQIDGRELYMHFPDGLGRPKLGWMEVVKMLKTTGTGRNLNTATKLLEMLEHHQTLPPR